MSLRSRPRSVALSLVALFVIQGVAISLYRALDRDAREAPLPPGFELDTLDGRRAPELDLITKDGVAHRWDGPEGKLTLVHFWATWCAPCRDELPALLEVASSHHGSLRVLAVSLDDGWPAVSLFFDDSIPAEIYRLADARARDRYGVSSLPDTFVVAASGELIARAHGPRDWRSAQARQLIQQWEGARP
jgi:thiol-disulfide isomerase/thioredoxin